ncbi:uncharacterized protein BDW70DRAFT_147407 [Aspergillus foveolatus]|uniref:uncharacterized protein n=1 Tax=Aspergillus foveolatus TaxID=210207 RepID=UPI003CCDECE9
MLRVLAGPESWRKDMMTERNLLSSSCLAGLPDSCAAAPAMSFDTSSTIDQRSESTMRCEQLQMGGYGGTDGQYLVTSAGLPNGDFSGRDFQTTGEQYRRWHADFSPVEPAKSVRPTSQNSFHWKLQKIDRPSTKDTFTVEELSSSSGSALTPDLVHPIPRHSPYAVTSYFTSEKIPETSTFEKAESPLSEDKKCLVRGSNWTSDDFAFTCLLQERQSPDASSLTTLPDNYTPVTTDGTYTDHSVSPWPSVKTQLSWDTQTANATQCKEEVAWNEPRFFPDVEPQQTHFDQFPAMADNIHGFPSLGHSAETYVQPSSLLDPYGSTCPGLYLNGNTITQQEQSPIPYSSSTLVYQNGLRPDESTDSFFPSGPISYQTSHVGHMATWTNDVKNALLIKYKRQGLSYKDIKRIAGFKEAESTLRGRFRTLTKSKEQRVRKPQWHEKDVRLLCEAVNVYSGDGRISPYSRRPVPPTKIPWKKVAQYIWNHGGSYHFGNSTCKKKWCEVQGL